MAHHSRPRPLGSQPNVRYGTVAPTVLPTDKKGDEYLLTPSGDNTTVATQSRVFDGITWELRPAGGAHLESLTRAQLIAKRTAGTLVPGVSYEITDHVQNRLVAGTTVTLLATSTTELSHDARVNTTYDNTSWFGLYDIDTALVYELRDNRGNVARGINGAEVANFDWGNTFITDVTVDNATWTTSYGATRTVNNSEFKNGSNINTSGQIGGIINRLVVDNQSTFVSTGANVSISNVSQTNVSTVNLANFTAGSTLGQYILNNSTINFSSSTSAVSLTGLTMYGSTLNHISVTTGTITGSNVQMYNNTTITHSNGAGNLSLNRVILENISNITQNTGIIALSDYRLSNQSTITQATGTTGNISLASGSMDGNSTINNQGNYNINGTRLTMNRNGQITIQNGATGTGTFTGSMIQGSSSITITSTATAGNATITNSNIDDGAFIQKSGIGILNISNLGLTNLSRVLHSGARNLTMTRIHMSNLGQINASATSAGITDSITDSSMLDRSSITLSATGATGNAIFYCNCTGINGQMMVSGTSSGQSIQSCQAKDGTIQWSNNTASINTLYAVAENISTITVQNMSITKSIQHIQAKMNSKVNINNPTGAGQHMWIIANDRSSITIQGTATTSQNLYAENQGVINHNGGQSLNITKMMTGTLTTGAFNHQNLVMISPASRTLTANNTSRSEYLGVTSATPLI